MIIVEQVKDSLDQEMEKLLWEVIHSSPGRLRVRVVYLPEYPHLKERLESAIASISGITNVFINSLMASVTINYNPEIIAEERLSRKILETVLQTTPLAWIESQHLGEKSSAEEETVLIKVQEVGGKLIGASIGKVMGLGVGAITGGILLGPIGLISGSKVGSVVGRMFGSSIGSETVRYFAEQTCETLKNAREKVDIAVKIQESLERSASELIGETIGGMAGVVIGTAVLGPVGSLVGSLVGGLIGGQMAEQIWCEQVKIKL